MSNDENNIDEGLSEDVEPDAPTEDDDSVDEDVLEDEVTAGDDEADTTGDSEPEAEAESDTEALDDLEAEELEMLTEDEASETIVVDEATQLRDIRRAQISIEASSAGGKTGDEFVCSICFLVKASSQMSNRRKKICLDCAD